MSDQENEAPKVDLSAASASFRKYFYDTLSATMPEIDSYVENKYTPLINQKNHLLLSKVEAQLAEEELKRAQNGGKKTEEGFLKIQDVKNPYEKVQKALEKSKTSLTSCVESGWAKMYRLGSQKEPKEFDHKNHIDACISQYKKDVYKSMRILEEI